MIEYYCRYCEYFHNCYDPNDSWLEVLFNHSLTHFTDISLDDFDIHIYYWLNECEE